MTNDLSPNPSSGLNHVVYNVTSYIIQIHRSLDDTDGGGDHDSDNDSNPELEDYSSSVVDKLGAVLWLMLLGLIIYKIKANDQERIALEEQERSQQEEASKKQLQLETERRERIISNATIRKRRGTIDITHSDGENAESSHDQDHERASLGKSDGDERSGSVEGYSALSCPICLDVFDRDDVITWSKELRCQHVYHENCLNPWLMKNDDCPICRTNLIIEGDYDDTNRKDGNGKKASDEEEKFDKDFVIINGLVSYVRKSILGRNGKQLKDAHEEDLEIANAVVDKEKETDELNLLEKTTHRKSFGRQSKKLYSILNTNGDDDDDDDDDDGGDLEMGGNTRTNAASDSEKEPFQSSTSFLAEN